MRGGGSRPRAEYARRLRTVTPTRAASWSTVRSRSTSSPSTVVTLTSRSAHPHGRRLVLCVSCLCHRAGCFIPDMASGGSVLLAADVRPAGGAAIGEVILATGIGLALTAVLLGLVFLHRTR